MLRADVGFIDTPVLRQRILIGFQAREKLDAAKDVVGEFGGHLGNGRDDAVEAKGNLGRISAFLQVDVARIRALGLLNKVFQNLRCREV